MLSGRARDNRLVHFAVPLGADAPRPGDFVTVAVTHAAPHHLVADSAPTGGPFTVRRTRAGDAWERARAGEGAGRGHGPAGGGTVVTAEGAGPLPVVLGLPGMPQPQR